MIYVNDAWGKLVEDFNSLRFLSLRDELIFTYNPYSISRSYTVVGTSLIIDLFVGHRDGSGYRISKSYYDYEDYEQEHLDFENFFEKLPDVIKEEVIFNLDLIR
jgi:hypothetical protein